MRKRRLDCAARVDHHALCSSALAHDSRHTTTPLKALCKATATPRHPADSADPGTILGSILSLLKSALFLP
eukprot:2508264-Rhodomonas_salina.1